MNYENLTHEDKLSLEHYNQHKETFSIKDPKGQGFPGYLYSKDADGDQDGGDFVGPKTLKKYGVDIAMFMRGEELANGQIAAAQAIDTDNNPSNDL